MTDRRGLVFGPFSPVEPFPTPPHRGLVILDLNSGLRGGKPEDGESYAGFGELVGKEMAEDEGDTVVGAKVGSDGVPLASPPCPRPPVPACGRRPPPPTDLERSIAASELGALFPGRVVFLALGVGPDGEGGIPLDVLATLYSARPVTCALDGQAFTSPLVDMVWS